MEFRLLGPLEVTSDGQPIELRAKERTLLAVLLLHANETVSTERLIDELWGARPPVSATKLVATYVWQLRKTLGEMIVTRAPGYAAVVSSDELDTALFDALVRRAETEQPDIAATTLREALALWRGPALADVTFESSAQGDVARLNDQRLTVLARRIEHDLALGRPENVIGELQALVREHPYRERFRAQLMLALYRSGRQSEALESYREARRQFVDELGIEPGAELQQLERSILAQDPVLEGPGTYEAPTEGASRAASKTALPRPASLFVGRDRELRNVLGAIEEGARLVTLTGPGGSGKTRLAVEAARILAPSLDHGAHWVGLASMRDPLLVMAAVAEAVGAKQDLVEHIGDREMLLLVDNLEHVIDAAADLAALLRECPNLRMLVTSRERMRVEGETEYPVPPMSGPDAISLFCKRASTQPSPDIEALCARLDNLPLAVELAAGRAKALSPTQLLELLSQRLDVFTGARDADPRQATLRATIEWSHDLLTPEERQLFARLAAFPGGCTFDAATEICGAGLDALQALVEKSLVRFSNERYWMLATIREFAAERLDESGEVDSVMERVGRWLVDLANAEGAPSFRGRVAEAYERLDLEHANVRAVVDWAVAKERYDRVAELVTVFRDVWTSRSNMLEVARWADQAVRARGTVAAELWPRVLLGVEQVRMFAGDRPGARAAAEEALDTLANIPPEPYLEAMILSELAALSCGDGHFEEARRYAQRSLDIRTSNGFPTGRAIHDLGQLALVEGDLEEAETLLEEARASSQARGAEHNVAVETRFLAEVARRRADTAEAARLFTDAALRFGELGDVDAVAGCLRDLAMVAKDRGDPHEAARLWASGNALSQFEPKAKHTAFPHEIGELPELDVEIGALTLEQALALASGKSG